MSDVSWSTLSSFCTSRLECSLQYALMRLFIKGKGSPYSITERMVPELIPVLGSQPAGDVSHKPGGRLAVTFRQARSYPRDP